MSGNARTGADSARTSEPERTDRRRGRAEGTSDRHLGESPVAEDRTHPFERLQRDRGNQSTRRLLEGRVQRKPAVGLERGRHELEAERWADAVRWGDRTERDGSLSPATGRVSGEAPVGPDLASYVERSRARGSPLPNSIRTTLERRFGTEFGDVRIHAGADAADASRRAEARAFTVGRDIHFGAGEYRPASTGGRELLAHELAHVVQQRASSERVQRVPAGESPTSGGTPSPEPADERRMVSTESPPRAGVSVSMTGVLFLPPEGTQFRPGSRAKQGSEIALYTLVGEENYTAALAAEFYQWGLSKEWYGEGSLAGEATGGETVTQFWFPSHLALQSVLWLERTKEVPVLLSDSQRELLYLGTASSDAWRLLNVPKVAGEMDVSLPSWYSEQLFRSQLAQNVGLLRSYIDAALLYHADRSEANRQNIVRALTNIVFELEFHAAVLEGIRADTALIDHWVYQLLWPTPRPEGMPADEQPEPQQAAENRPPHPSIASQFLSFLYSQQSLVDRSWNETEARRELLDRFGRFLERGVSGPPSGDQQVRDQPGTANAPPIPAQMSVSPPLSGPPSGPQFEASSEADYRFVMSIQFPDVFAAFQSYYYEWNYVRIPEDRQTASFDELDPQTPSGWDVAGQRFGRTTRYAEEDFQTVFEELGPAGVAATSLVAANAILGYVGEGIRLGIEILTTPASEKSIAFPGPGTYLVRCKAIPYTGEDAEVVRPPSVAYYPVIVRDPVQLVERRNRERGATTAWEHERMAELRELLSQPVSHLNEDQLRQELDTLERSLSSVGGALSVQREKLVEYRNSLPVGSADRARVQTQIERLDVIIALRADRGEERDLTNAEPLVATFVSDKGESIQLTMEALYRGAEGGEVEYWVSDLTTANGGEDYGTGSDRAEAIMDAVGNILRGYAGYGRGYVAVQIDGETHSKRIKASAGALFMEAVENVTMVLSIAAVAAAPFTGGATITLLLPIGAVGAIPSGYRVINRAIDDTLRFDMATVMDVVNVVGGFAGVGHATTPLRMVNTGRVFYVMGLGADGLGVMLVPAEIATQIAALEGIPDGERRARIMEILGQAMLDAGISAGGALAHRAQQHRMGTPMDPSRGETAPRPRAGDAESPLEPTQPAAPPEPDVAPERRPTDEGETRRPRDAPEGREPTGDLVARRTQDGEHTLRVTKRGQIIRCSDRCPILRVRYRHVLDDSPELGQRLTSLEERARHAAEANDQRLADQVAADAQVLEADLRSAERAWANRLGFDADRIELLLQELTGAEIQALAARHSADVVHWAGTELNGQQTRQLLTGLDPAAAAGLRDISASRAHRLVEQYGHDLLNRVAPTVGGGNLVVLADSLGTVTARSIAADKAGGGQLSKLEEYAASLRSARSPTGTGELVSPSALGPSSVVVDANYLQYLHFATQKVAGGMPVDQLPAVERNVYLDYQRRLAAGDVDLRVPNVAIGESGGKVSSAPSRHGLPIDPSVRNSAEYGDVLGRLEANGVGGTGDAAAADRAVVADAFFSVPAGQRATFLTADGKVLKGLARLAGHDPRTLNKTVPDAFPNGFEATVTAGGTTRKLWVIPISGR